MNWHRDQKRLANIAAKQEANKPQAPVKAAKPTTRYGRMMAKKRRK